LKVLAEDLVIKVFFVKEAPMSHDFLSSIDIRGEGAFVAKQALTYLRIFTVW
jgi:hypothetical protein